MKAEDLKAGMVVVIDETTYRVRGVEKEVDLPGGATRPISHGGHRAVLVDCIKRPGNRRDEGRVQFYLRPYQEVEVSNAKG